ncbi:MAG: hypothetical protein LH465_09190 [Sphingomonas bacterium]|nr:hypothetical protein [Sphingomonas bacterium]
MLLLMIGVVGVWQRDWRPMWGAQAYMALFVLVCLTVDFWYGWVGMSRGDGFALLGLMMFGVFAGAIALFVLLVGAIIHAVRGPRPTGQDNI